MKSRRRLGELEVAAGGAGVVSHAGAELLRELAEATGLVEVWSEASADAYSGL